MKKLILLLLTIHPVFSQNGTINISGIINNRKSDTIYIGKGNFNTFMIVGNKGLFKSSFDGEPGKYYLINGKDYVDIYLEKGFDIYLNADGRDFKKSLYFKGKGAKENVLFARQDANSLATERDIINGIDNLKAFNKAFGEGMKEFRSELTDKSFSNDFRKFMEEELGHDEHNFPTMAEQQYKRQNLKGKPLPAFRYENATGGFTRNEDLKGRYLLIDIWATWCKPCHDEMPFLHNLEERYKGRNISFVSISIDRQEEHDKWKKIVVDKGLGGVQILADNNFESEAIKALAVNFVPRFIIVDPQGIIIDADAKKPSDPALAEQLNNLLD